MHVPPTLWTGVRVILRQRVQKTERVRNCRDTHAPWKNIVSVQRNLSRVFEFGGAPFCMLSRVAYIIIITVTRPY